MIDFCIGTLANVVGGRLRMAVLPPLGGLWEPIERIVVDVERVACNDVFWGLPGRKSGGSRLAEEAFRRGALGAVVSGRRLEPWAGKFSLQVDDTCDALWRLARWVRAHFAGKVIAVAGGDAEWTASLVHAALRWAWDGGVVARCAGEGRLAVPLGLIDLLAAESYGVLPLRRGDIAAAQQSHLAECKPDVLVLGGSESEQTDEMRGDDRSQWRSLLTGCSSDCAIVAAAGDRPIETLLRRHRGPVVRVGQTADCDVQIQRESEGRWWLTYDGESAAVELPSGEAAQTATSIALACAAAVALGCRLADAAGSLRQWGCLPSQCRMYRFGQCVLIDDGWQNDQGAVVQAIRALDRLAGGGRRLLVWRASGGAESRPTVQQSGWRLARDVQPDIVIAVGDYSQAVVDAARHAGLNADVVACAQQSDAIRALQQRCREGDIVIVNGLGPHAATQLAQQLRQAVQPALDAPGRGATNAHQATGVRPFASVMRETDATLPPG